MGPFNDEGVVHMLEAIMASVLVIAALFYVNSSAIVPPADKQENLGILSSDLINVLMYRDNSLEHPSLGFTLSSGSQWNDSKNAMGSDLESMLPNGVYYYMVTPYGDLGNEPADGVKTFSRPFMAYGGGTRDIRLQACALEAVLMGDEGQMILLSALVACLCLFGVVACVEAVSDISPSESGYLSSVSVQNILWTQDTALENAASYYSAYPWPERANAVTMFKNEANLSMQNLSYSLLKHGAGYNFTYNESLAGDYLTTHRENDTENIGGVLVRDHNGSENIYGCAYDADVDDSFSKYEVSRVVIFG